MAKNRRSLGMIGKLLPTGVLGLSIGLASAGAPVLDVRTFSNSAKPFLIIR